VDFFIQQVLSGSKILTHLFCKPVTSRARLYDQKGYCREKRKDSTTYLADRSRTLGTSLDFALALDIALIELKLEHDT
jgi:hypothetical protein